MIRTNNSTNKQNFSKPIPSIFSIFSRLVGGHFRFLFSLIKHRLYTHNAASFSLFFFQRITQSSTDFVLKKKTLKKIRRRGGIVIFLITKKKEKPQHITHDTQHVPFRPIKRETINRLQTLCQIPRSHTQKEQTIGFRAKGISFPYETTEQNTCQKFSNFFFFFFLPMRQKNGDGLIRPRGG